MVKEAFSRRNSSAEPEYECRVATSVPEYSFAQSDVSLGLRCLDT